MKSSQHVLLTSVGNVGVGLLPPSYRAQGLPPQRLQDRDLLLPWCHLPGLGQIVSLFAMAIELFRQRGVRD